MMSLPVQGVSVQGDTPPYGKEWVVHFLLECILVLTLNRIPATFAGFDGTSNVLAGKLFGIPVKGTHAHAFVNSFTDLDDIKHTVRFCLYDDWARSLYRN